MSGITFTYNYTAAGTKAPVITLVADKVDEVQPDIVCNVPIENMNLLFQFEQDVVDNQTKVGGITGTVSANDRILRLDFLPLDQYVRGIHAGLVQSSTTFADDGQTPPDTLTTKSNSLSSGSGDTLLNKLPAAALISRTNGQMALVQLLMETLQSGPLFYNPNTMSPNASNEAIRLLFGQAVEQGMLSTDNSDEANQAYVSNGIGFPAYKVVFEEGQYLDINVKFTVSTDFIYQIQSALGSQFTRGGTFTVGNEQFTIDADGYLSRQNGAPPTSIDALYRMRFIASDLNASSLSLSDTTKKIQYNSAIKDLVSLYAIPASPPPTTSDQVHAFDLKLRTTVLNDTQLADFKTKITNIRNFIDTASGLDYSVFSRGSLMPTINAINWFKETPTRVIDTEYATLPEDQIVSTLIKDKLSLNESEFISGTVFPINPVAKYNTAQDFTLTTKYLLANFDMMWMIAYPSQGVVKLPEWTARHLIVIPWLFSTLTITDRNGSTVTLNKSSSDVSNGAIATVENSTTEVFAVYGRADDKSWIVIGPTDKMIATYLLNNTVPTTQNKYAYYYVANEAGQYLTKVRFNNSVHIQKCYIKDQSDLQIKSANADMGSSSSFTIRTVGFNPTINNATANKDFAVLPSSGVRYKIPAVPRGLNDGIILDNLFSSTEPQILANSYMFVYNTAASSFKNYVYLKDQGGSNKHAYFRHSFTTTSSADTNLSLSNTVAITTNNAIVQFPSTAATSLANLTGLVAYTSTNNVNYVRAAIVNQGSNPYTVSNIVRVPYITDLTTGTLLHSLLTTAATYNADTFYYAGSLRSTPQILSTSNIGNLKLFNKNTISFYSSGTPSNNLVSAPPVTDLEVTNNKIDLLRATTSGNTTTYNHYQIDVIPTEGALYDRYADMYITTIDVAAQADRLSGAAMAVDAPTSIYHVDADDAGTGLVIMLDSRVVPSAVLSTPANYVMYYVKKTGSTITKTVCTLNPQQTVLGTEFMTATCPSGTLDPNGYLFVFIVKNSAQNSNGTVYVPKINPLNITVKVGVRESDYNILNDNKKSLVYRVPPANSGDIGGIQNGSLYPMLLRLLDTSYGYLYYFCLANPPSTGSFNPFNDSTRWTTLLNLTYSDVPTNTVNKAGGDPRNQFVEFSSLIAGKTGSQVELRSYLTDQCTCVFETVGDTTTYYICSRVPPPEKRLTSPSDATMRSYWAPVGPMADLTGYFNNSATYTAYTPPTGGSSHGGGGQPTSLPTTANLYDCVTTMITDPETGVSYTNTINGTAAPASTQVVPPFLISYNNGTGPEYYVGNDSNVTITADTMNGIAIMQSGNLYTGDNTTLGEALSGVPTSTLTGKAAYTTDAARLTGNNVIGEMGQFYLIKSNATLPLTQAPSQDMTPYIQFTFRNG